MLITLMATVGLCFIVALVYRKGRRDGVRDTIEYYAKEMKKREILHENIFIEDQSKELKKSRLASYLPFLKWGKTK